MADWVPILPAEYEPEAPLTSSLGARWSTNIEAMAEGSEGAPRMIRGAVNTRREVLDTVGSGTWTAPASLAVGTYIKVTRSGGGGGGGGGYQVGGGSGNNGDDGNPTEFESLPNAPGGIGGRGGSNGRNGASVASLIGLRGGAVGGMGGTGDGVTGNSGDSGTNGIAGGERTEYIQLGVSEQQFDYTVGGGGSGGSGATGAGNGSDGADGYIFIEY